MRKQLEEADIGRYEIQVWSWHEATQLVFFGLSCVWRESATEQIFANRLADGPEAKCLFRACHVAEVSAT